MIDSALAIRAAVAGAGITKPMEQRSTYERAFRQVTNLWLRDSRIHRLVAGRRLARTAAELLGVRGVRLYHDQALFKEPGGGKTPWHADQHYWPLASDRTVTAWIPLVDILPDMGPLVFAPGSQRMLAARRAAEQEISDRSELEIGSVLADFPQVEEPFALGDVSFHLGWHLHHAGANRSGVIREVMTIIFMDMDMVIAEPRNQAQRHDLNNWLPGRQPGETAASPINPVLWEAP